MAKAAQEVQKQELNDSRKGTIYFLSQLEFNTVPSFDLGVTGKFLVNTEPLNDLKAGCEYLISKTPVPKMALFDKTPEIFTTVGNYIKQFFDVMLEKLKDIFGDNLFGVEWLSEFALWAIQDMTGSLANLVPCWGYVRQAADMYSAIKSAVSNTIKLFTQGWSGYGVHLLQGTPSTIAQSLALHSGAGICHGLKDLTMKSLNIGLQAAGDAAAGIGGLVSLITDILERIVQLVMYVIQRFQLHRITDVAKATWKEQDGLLTHIDQFAKWFSRHAVCTPIIPTLVLQSGYVANPTRFLALFTNEHDVISQDEFNNGVKHISKLKSLSRSYMKEYKNVYKLEFRSSDPVSEALLKGCYE